MSKHPPPSHFVSSLSEDDNDASSPKKDVVTSPPPPPPPPPAIAQGPTPVTANTSNKQRTSPPSLLRTNNRGTSKNSVAFSGVMDNLAAAAADTKSSTPATVAAAAAAAKAAANPSLSPPAARPELLTALGRGVSAPAPPHISASSSSAKQKLTASFTSRSGQHISLDTIINSQFENEAETHILAALESEEVGLMGEGIDGGMEDYSDDSQHGESAYDQRHARNDSFLRKLTLQNELPQYQMSPSSISSSSPEKKSQMQQQSQQQQTSQSSSNHHRYQSSTRGSSGYLPSVPDDAALIYDSNDLAIHIQEEHMEEGDDPFLEGAKTKSSAATNSTRDILDKDVDNAALQQQDWKDLHASGASSTGQSEAESAPDDDEVNIMTHTTETTDNINFMAKRLRSLQKRRGSLSRISSRRSSLTDNNVAAGGLGGDPESYGDKLIDALNSVDSSRNKSWISKIRNEYTELIVPKLPIFRKSVSHTLLFVVFPFLSIAALLFYMFDNPMAGDSGTSVSWWLLFLGVRQMLTFEMTRVGEVFWVEILALRSKMFNMAVGPYVSLAFIQSKGWPYIICFWAVLDFIFLYGNYAFPKHWLFWQVKLDLFNEANPVVGITDNVFYMRILITMIFVGVAVSLKRLFLAIYLGRRSVAHFGSELEKLMAKMILIGEVANLARDIENKRSLFEEALSPTQIGDDEKLVRFRDYMRDEYSSADESSSPRVTSRKILEAPSPTSSSKGSPSRQQRLLEMPPSPHSESPGSGTIGKLRKSSDASESPALGKLRKNSDASAQKSSPASTASQQGATMGTKSSPGTTGFHQGPLGGGDYSPPRHPPVRTSTADTSTVEGGAKKGINTSSTSAVKLMYLLSEWEEPELVSGKNTKATVRDLVEFRKAVSYMDDKYPFSHAFGHAKTREMCVQSSQEVYDRLMLSASDCSALPFSIISVLAMDENGEFMEAKIKSLIRLFRPDRQGNLSRLDFVKSIDTVYKKLRLLRASIANSAQIDHAFEKIINVFFYFFMVIIAVAILGVNIWTVFLSFNTFFLGFSFLFGAAASNYFEGLLLIFVRRPYDIGDRIATSNPKSDTSPNGSSTWFVDKVTLFTTTVRFATTNEVATYSNGSLAILRIINANRSPKAIISVLIKFGLETPFSKVTVFRAAVESFIKARPREWISLAGFRATRVEADYGYVEYKIVAQHRESWQNIGPVLQSKADLSSFCLEATKKLSMKYESPPMPVNLLTSGNIDLSGIFNGEDNRPRGDTVDMTGSEKKSVSAEDLQEVANLFEIRKSK